MSKILYFDTVSKNIIGSKSLKDLLETHGAMNFIANFNEADKNSKIMILSHNDPDGYGSAAVLIDMIEKKKFSNFSLYNIGYDFDLSTIENELSISNFVFISDLSFKQDQIDYLNKVVAGKVLWIDHHLSSISINKRKINSIIVAEDGISAMALCEYYANLQIALEYLNNVPYREIVKEVSWFDTFYDGMSLAFIYGLETHNINTMEEEGKKFWKELLKKSSEIDKLIKDGEVIQKYLIIQNEKHLNEQGIELKVEISRFTENGSFEKKNYKLLAMNKNGFSSLFNDKFEEYDGCIRYYQKKDGNWSYSIYSSKKRKTAINCEMFAKKYGGGGHLHAAGFSANRNIISNIIFGSTDKTLRIHIN